jgi:hypothetical protein
MTRGSWGRFNKHKQTTKLFVIPAQAGIGTSSLQARTLLKEKIGLASRVIIGPYSRLRGNDKNYFVIFV